jgi:hypothetical protein
VGDKDWTRRERRQQRTPYEVLDQGLVFAGMPATMTGKRRARAVRCMVIKEEGKSAFLFVGGEQD